MSTYYGWATPETWTLVAAIQRTPELAEVYRDVDTHEEARAITLALLRPEEFQEQFGEPWPDWLRDLALEVGSLWRVDFDQVAAHT